jgi:hypothetical protein
MFFPGEIAITRRLADIPFCAVTQSFIHPLDIVPDYA